MPPTPYTTAVCPQTHVQTIHRVGRARQRFRQRGGFEGYLVRNLIYVRILCLYILRHRAVKHGADDLQMRAGVEFAAHTRRTGVALHYGIDRHAIAFAEQAHLFGRCAHLRHHAGKFMAEDQRPLAIRRIQRTFSIIVYQIGAANAARLYLDQDFIILNLRNIFLTIDHLIGLHEAIYPHLTRHVSSSLSDQQSLQYFLFSASTNLKQSSVTAHAFGHSHRSIAHQSPL